MIKERILQKGLYPKILDLYAFNEQESIDKIGYLLEAIEAKGSHIIEVNTSLMGIIIQKFGYKLDLVKTSDIVDFLTKHLEEYLENIIINEDSHLNRVNELLPGKSFTEKSNLKGILNEMFGNLEVITDQNLQDIADVIIEIERMMDAKEIHTATFRGKPSKNRIAIMFSLRPEDNVESIHQFIYRHLVISEQ